MKKIDWEQVLGQHHTALPDLSVLDAQSEEHLFALTQATLERERAALHAALEDSLSFVPRLLRGPVRKLLSR